MNLSCVGSGCFEQIGWLQFELGDYLFQQWNDFLGFTDFAHRLFKAFLHLSECLGHWDLHNGSLDATFSIVMGSADER